MPVVRITRGKVRPGAWQEYESALRRVIAKAGSVDGLLSRTLAQDLEDPDAGYAISLWESVDAIEKYESLEQARQDRAELHEFFTGEYKTSLCEVRYWDDTAFELLPGID